MRSFLGRLSVILLLILSIILFAGIIIPQKGLFENDYRALVESYPRLASFLDTLGLTEIYSSPLWFILVAALTVNIALCSLYRIKPLIRRARPEAPSASELENLDLPPPPIPLPQGEGVKRGSSFSLDSELSPPELLTSLRNTLSSLRYQVCVEEKGRGFRAVKNRLAPFGSLIFHLSFIIFLIGGIISVKTRFVRNIILAEGQSFSSREIAGGKVEMPDLGIRVKKIKPVYEGGSYLTDLSGRVKIYHDRKEDEVTIKVNRPFSYKSMSILLKDFGITPLYILRDAEGKELDGAFVNLSILGPEKEDHFNIPGTPYT
ncbi:MAG: cytochrome c biogenesis protein ResB, partial [Deltaproteobacteria bacterium]